MWEYLWKKRLGWKNPEESWRKTCFVGSVDAIAGLAVVVDQAVVSAAVDAAWEGADCVFPVLLHAATLRVVQNPVARAVGAFVETAVVPVWIVDHCSYA